MQALSQLSYGPTWRRGTLPDGDQFVKKMNDLARPTDGQRPASIATSASVCPRMAKRGIDGRRHGAAAYRQANRLRKLAERDALGGREAADELRESPAADQSAN